MEESLRNFPFRKLMLNKFLTLDVMMCIEKYKVLQFMFTLNNQTRSFLVKNFISVRNGFINEGLITFYLNHDFESYKSFEQLYF